MHTLSLQLIDLGAHLQLICGQKRGRSPEREGEFFLPLIQRGFEGTPVTPENERKKTGNLRYETAMAKRPMATKRAKSMETSSHLVQLTL
jgi:hypothetical protein